MKFISGSFHIDPEYLDLTHQDFSKEPLSLILARAASAYIDATLGDRGHTTVFTNGTAINIALTGFCDMNGQNEPVLSINLKEIFENALEFEGASDLVLIRDMLDEILSNR